MSAAEKPILPAPGAPPANAIAPGAPPAGATGSADPLARPVESLAGVGPARAKALRDLGVATLGDLLEYYPRDYQLETAERPIADLGTDGVQTTRGEVVAVNYVPSRPRPRFEATLDDGAGKCGLVWFHGAYLRRQIHPGITLRVKGKVRLFHNIPQMTNPKWELVEPDETPDPDAKSRFRPIYPASSNLPSDTLERIVADNLDDALAAVAEWYSPELLARRKLCPRPDAHRLIHQPPDLRAAMFARRRLIYDELMLMQLGLGISKRLRDGRLTAPILRVDKTLDQRIARRFPFTMTPAQRNAVFDIIKDLQTGRPMHRLLQGDVGSGKTAVALYAMLMAVANRMQAALLTPTEVLAEQHFLTISNLLADSSVGVELFTSRTRRKRGDDARQRLTDGEAHLAIGTQALLQEGIDFANLGLVVVDEQHKLGVRQRATLRSKGHAPHYLVMTATPIPRTLALSYFADFDVTTINELPPGRQPIETRWLRSRQASEAYNLIRHEVANGRQAYIVLPRIDDDDADGAQGVVKRFAELSKKELSGLRLGMLHGQLPIEEKRRVMESFRDGQTDVLVATTVIEVGIDVPNATVMLIDHADAFGLSQLHQLRGRVGRGPNPSFCVLVADPLTDSAESRLSAMTRTADGFEIAEMDLALRGPGQFFGTRQHGLPEFKLTDLTGELEMLQTAKDDATALLADDPRLSSPRHAALRRALLDQFGDTLDLPRIG